MQTRVVLKRICIVFYAVFGEYVGLFVSFDVGMCFDFVEGGCLCTIF